jgi:GNAT superfamily N-acetyltransferase
MTPDDGPEQRLSPRIELLQACDLIATADLLARTFESNPCYCFMHPRVAQRASDMKAFFMRNLEWRAPLRLTWVARDARGDIVGTATLQPPTPMRRRASEVVTHWLWPTLRDQGAHTLTRTVRLERALLRHERQVAGQVPYWYVHAVAVRSDAKGRSVGTKLMHTLLEEVAARDAGALRPVVLSTQAEPNVRFYERLGFRLIRRATIGRSVHRAGFSSWFMRHGPPGL